MDLKLRDSVLSQAGELDDQPIKTDPTYANQNSDEDLLNKNRETDPPSYPPGQTLSEPQMDSGWSWFVLAGSFVVYFTALGSSSSLSVYLTVWMESFEASAATVGFVISIHSFMRGMFGPISGMFCKKFGCRVVMIVGGLILTGGFLMAAVSPTVEILMISNGLVTALGSSLSLSAVFQALGMYFKKKFTLAVGLSTSGISLGQLAFAPLYTYLIDLYGWRGSMIIVAGISFHLVAAGALMRPNVPRTTRPQAPRTARLNHELQSVNGHHEMDSKQVTLESADSSRLNENIIQQNGVNLSLKSTGEDHGHDNPSKTTLSNGDVTDKYVGSTEPKAGFPPPCHNPSVTVEDDRDDQTSDREPARPPSPCGRVLEYLSLFKYFMLETYGLRRLAKNVDFIIMMVGAVCHGFGKLGVVYTVARAESIGVEPELASLLLSMIGAGSTVARVTHGWFIDKKYITAEMTYTLAMLVFSVTDILTPWLVTYLPLVILSIFMGMAAGLAASVLIVVSRSFVEPSDASGAFGAQLFFWGVGDILGVLVTGIVYDNLQSYDIAYFIGGGVLFIGFVLTLYVSVSRRRRQRCKLLDAEATVQPSEETQMQAVYPGSSRLEPELLGSSGRPDEDGGCVNPAYAVTGDEDISVGDVPVILLDDAGAKANLPEIRTEHLMPSSEVEDEVGDTDGIENPMTITQTSVDITDGSELTVL